MSFSCIQELADTFAAKNARGEKIPAFDLRQFTRVIELAPQDMTVTVETGLALAQLQEQLGRQGQWLPIDPPSPATLILHDILANNLSGPRRFGYGTVRDHLIGMKVVLADGRTIKSGGKVVKNVAGYDLAKLFIGARGSLGVIVEATFKVRPLPEVERFVSRVVALEEGAVLVRALLESDLVPVILDMYRGANATEISVVLGFAGTRAEVEWQLGVARSFGFTAEATLDYEARFWADFGPVNHISVLSSRLADVISGLGPAPFVARAGNGVIYFRGKRVPEKKYPPVELTRRIKMAFDPKARLPEIPQ